MSTCFALLDDNTAHPGNPSSRLYTSLQKTLTLHHSDELPNVLAQMQSALAQGLYAVPVLHYELGDGIHAIAASKRPSTVGQILLFSDCRHLTRDEVDRWLQQQSSPCGFTNITPSVTTSAFTNAIDRIRHYIAAGDTYQVNYTFRLSFTAYGELTALYQALRAAQPVPFGACIQLPDGQAILSMSPELFITHIDGTLTARPMKGTAAATDNEQDNAQQSALLAADPKNRAENLMIVDLLRNDISRIAQIGSVKVPKLFEVTRFSQVLQMTSTITANLHPDARLHDIITALFPCGSITGAPKRRAMQIIREIEPTPRGIYTGAIGWFDPPTNTQTIGNFCMSVPIRTLALGAEVDGWRTGIMGVGAGIVYDSQPQDEYAECLLKARFITQMKANFDLFETMFATLENGCRHLDAHLDRISSSAHYFGFTVDPQAIRTALTSACSALLPDTNYRLRLALSPHGKITITSAPMQALADQTVTVFVAQHPRQQHPIFLQHKTTVRAFYDAAWQEAESFGGFDTLFFNQEGYLTEGGRTNVFVKLAGQWCTPPISAGLLPGVMRTQLLNDPLYAAIEKNITRAELAEAEEIVICNALRGALAAKIDWDVCTSH
jgi:para-aminobenzoate synthetase/4-amino-4-deoxychorismate lyase